MGKVTPLFLDPFIWDQLFHLMPTKGNLFNNRAEIETCFEHVVIRFYSHNTIDLYSSKVLPELIFNIKLYLMQYHHELLKSVFDAKLRFIFIEISNPDSTRPSLNVLIRDMIRHSVSGYVENMIYSIYNIYERAFRFLPESFADPKEAHKSSELITLIFTATGSSTAEEADGIIQSLGMKYSDEDCLKPPFQDYAHSNNNNNNNNNNNSKEEENVILSTRRYKEIIEIPGHLGIVQDYWSDNENNEYDRISQIETEIEKSKMDLLLGEKNNINNNNSSNQPAPPYNTAINNNTKTLAYMSEQALIDQAMAASLQDLGMSDMPYDEESVLSQVLQQSYQEYTSAITLKPNRDSPVTPTYVGMCDD